MITSEELGFRIKHVRKKIGLSQLEFSKLTELQQPLISKMENGKGFSLQTFLTIVGYLNKYIETDELLKDNFNIHQFDLKKKLD